MLTAFELPSGPGVRIDSFGYAGYRTSAALRLAAGQGDRAHAVDRLRRRRSPRPTGRSPSCSIEGVPTNAALPAGLLRHPDFVAGAATTRFVDEHIGRAGRRRRADSRADSRRARPMRRRALAGAKVDAADPLAVLDHGKRRRSPTAPGRAGRAGAGRRRSTGRRARSRVRAPLQGTVVGVDVADGDPVRAGQQLLVMEAMKMEHVVAGAEARLRAPASAVAVGDTVFEGHPLVFVEPADVGDRVATATTRRSTSTPSAPTCAEVLERHAITPRRGPARRRGPAPQDRPAHGPREHRRPLRRRLVRRVRQRWCCRPAPALPIDELIRKSPADGMVVRRRQRQRRPVRPTTAARCVVMAYDYTVLAGTQGAINHPKTDRMFELAEAWRLPVVFFTEGGGGRPAGDTDGERRTRRPAFLTRPLVTPTFASMARLNGVVPDVGINSGRCFAGNAALLGAAT